MDRDVWLVVAGGLVGAAVGLLGGLLVAGIGSWTTLRAAANQRKHERAMAREQRLQDRGARAYERVLEHVYRLDASVERTHPFIGPAQDPPPMLPDDEIFKLNALTAAYASPEMLALTRSIADLSRRFNAAAWLVGEERQGRGIDGESGWLKLEETREAFHSAVRAFGDRASEELRGAG